MKIRKFQEEDTASVIKLWQDVFPDDPPHNEPAQVLDSKLDVDDLIFVAEYQNVIIGACMAGYDGHRGWLYAVAVYPGHRRLGAGGALVRHTIDALKKLGCIKVNLQIRANNTNVAAFYQSLGFKIEDRLSLGLLIPD